MKKTYIKPTTMAVKLETSHTLLVASQQDVQVSENAYNGSTTIESREVINTPDAWEEW